MRLNLKKTDSTIYQHLGAIDKELAQSGLDRWIWEMIKIRASQINSCAYCVDKHTQDALTLGISPRKISLVSVWREAKNHFSEEEQLILRLTEEVSLIHQYGLSDEVFNGCAGAFGVELTGKIIVAAIMINTWNRLGVSLKMEPAL